MNCIGVTIPGDVFELGVYKAASLIRSASFRATKFFFEWQTFGSGPYVAVSNSSVHLQVLAKKTRARTPTPSAATAIETALALRDESQDLSVDMTGGSLDLFPLCIGVLRGAYPIFLLVELQQSRYPNLPQCAS